MMICHCRCFSMASASAISAESSAANVLVSSVPIAPLGLNLRGVGVKVRASDRSPDDPSGPYNRGRGGHP